jgi:hypothetical protein
VNTMDPAAAQNALQPARSRLRDQKKWAPARRPEASWARYERDADGPPVGGPS